MDTVKKRVKKMSWKDELLLMTLYKMNNKIKC